MRNCVIYILVLFCCCPEGKLTEYTDLENVTENEKEIDNPVIKTKDGLVQGVYKYSGKNRTYAGFYGIPFARPPIGELRFKNPQPAAQWRGILRVHTYKAVCVQLSATSKVDVIGDEDCLYLNVYKPLHSVRKLPVMVYFYGGAYSRGTPAVNPELLLEEGVMVVTLSYRLGVLGFLCLDTPEVPGNAGLRDQGQALKWIQENIEFFGGDPDDVTLFGLSAGGSSVNNQQFSEESKGLFHRVISMSGTTLTPWGLQTAPDKIVLKLIEYLGINGSDILGDLQRTAADVLIRAGNMIASDPTGFVEEPPFSPVIELEFDGVVPFLSDDPKELIKNGEFYKVPVMIGITSKEYLQFTVVEKIQHYFINNNNTIVPKRWRLFSSQTVINKLAEEIRQFYFGNKEFDKENEEMFAKAVELLGDITFAMPSLETGRLLVRHGQSPVYLYRFSYRGTLNSDIIEKIGVQGATHGDDKRYIFPDEIGEIDDKSSDGWVRRRMVKMLTNFAKFGNPTPGPTDMLLPRKWLPMTSEVSNYLEINGEIVPSVNPEEERRIFWEALKSKWMNGDV